MSLSQQALRYIEVHREETMHLLMELARIPAPSNHEEQRAAFCEDWLRKNGVKGVYSDSVLNVICPFGDCGKDSPVTVFMAHSDVVFPDTEELPLRTENGRLYCPGIGDDTVHVVNLLMAARYLAESELAPRDGGVLLVVNSGEEGLGNLRGSRRITDEFGDRMQAFYTFDSCNGAISNAAVGSRRYRVAIRTEGGHSYSAFGNRNAIVYLASLIDALYRIKPPEGGKTTCNVGTIEGGTSVNTIAQHAEMLYEFRSTNAESLRVMDTHFHAAIEFYRTKGVAVDVELVGERPCGENVDPNKEQALMDKAAEAVRAHFGLEPLFRASSTDCNIPLSRGIPAVNTGCFLGGGAHTREEYLEIDSIFPSQKLAFDLILSCL